MTAITSAFDEIARLMATGIKAEELIAYEIPSAYIERYQILVRKEKDGIIDEEERRALDALLMINHVISMAKLMAVKKLEAA